MKILPIASAIIMTVTLVATSVPAIAQITPTNYTYNSYYNHHHTICHIHCFYTNSSHHYRGCSQRCREI